MYIINVKIMPIGCHYIEKGYIHIIGSIITAVGEMDELTDSFNEIVIDAKGAMAFPGFIDCHCHIGMWEDGIGSEGVDVNEIMNPISPQFRAIDAINPQDAAFSEAVSAGVTLVVTGPGSKNVIGGQMAAIKTYGNRIDDMIVKAPIAIKIAFGENPKKAYSQRNEAPTTRMTISEIFRKALIETKNYAADKEIENCNSTKTHILFNEKYEALIPLLRGEIKAHIHAHRADDICSAIRIAKEFSLKYVLVHATDSHLLSDSTLDETVEIILGPYINGRSKVELKNKSARNAGILERGSYKFAICSDSPVLPLQYLPICAGTAVMEGLTYWHAIESITINAAKILELDSRVGSIAVGKDADISIFDSDPLSVYSKPKMVLINGAVVFCQSIQASL